jgi:hypothetical protein
MALHAPRSSPVSSTHGCIWHCARTRPSTVNQHHPSQLELATKLPKEPGVRVLRVHETLHALVPRPCSSPILICLCERAPMATASVSVPRYMPAAALAVHGLFVVRLDTAGWLWRPTKTSGGRGPSAVERYLTAFGHSEITEFYQSTTHSASADVRPNLADEVWVVLRCLSVGIAAGPVQTLLLFGYSTRITVGKGKPNPRFFHAQRAWS